MIERITFLSAAATILSWTLASPPVAVQDAPAGKDGAIVLSKTDAAADVAKLRAAYEALDRLGSEAERKAGFARLVPVMREYVKAYDGKVSEGLPLVGLGLAQMFGGDQDRGEKILADYRKSLVGKPAPSLEVEKVIGGAEPLSLDALRGKVVLLDFWATWCPPCRALIPSLVEVSNQYAPKGLAVVGATQLYGYGWRQGKTVTGLDRAAEIQVNEDFRTDQKLPYPIALTKQNTGMFNYAVTSIPTVFLIDRAGKVRWTSDHAASDHGAMKQKLDELLQESAAQ